MVKLRSIDAQLILASDSRKCNAQVNLVNAMPEQLFCRFDDWSTESRHKLVREKKEEQDWSVVFVKSGLKLAWGGGLSR
jgi:hypothetical protein